jgi:L-amino acid N-acyltransferase YncA
MVEHTEIVKLKDCSEIIIRTRTSEDMDAVFDFYQSLTEEEKDLAQIDLRDKNSVIQRFEEMEERGHDRVLAICKDSGKVIGEAILESMLYGWMRKTGQMRILLHPDYLVEEIAHHLLREMFLLAARRGMNHLTFKVLDGEKEMYEILKALHFKHEATQKKHVVDVQGKTHDVHLMTYSLRKMWRDIEEVFRAADSFPSEY